jgi:monofunctional biosynthetic peptidoglycan transglycosylase
VSPLRRLGILRTLALALAGALILTVGYQVWTWPDVAALARQRPMSTAFIERYREQQRVKGRNDRVDWRWVPYGSIAPSLKRAVLVAEDVNFFSHRGFDVAEIEKALREAVEEGESPRGASTITQQLAKNLWLSPSRHPYRKLKEAILTWQLERTLGKRRIFELYLNVVEFGPGVFGAEAASRRYFSKTAADLGEDESAQLAASLPNPATWHPGAPSRTYQRRVAAIRRRMDKADFLGRQVGVTEDTGRGQLGRGVKLFTETYWSGHARS